MLVWIFMWKHDIGAIQRRVKWPIYVVTVSVSFNLWRGHKRSFKRRTRFGVGPSSVNHWTWGQRMEDIADQAPLQRNIACSKYSGDRGSKGKPLSDFECYWCCDARFFFLSASMDSFKRFIWSQTCYERSSKLRD